ncbi:Rv0361 family membrane protein [Rhodococcus tibetensis]|uniref:Uncharacterized protein n=1 Tax=Rhodococcus tibetensis TaxID=2965064 RepID=A0ABT1QAC4_9NOCA|nr:hypothetical protein [Rhodococcus sp. FXJ9.536]MCQ4118077.1 hypothetical protein [Rhodococcus sp. FXJ9.536]
MSDPSELPRGAAGGDPEDPRRTTATPFIAAVVLVVVILVAIVVGGMLSPADRNVTEADRITRSVADYIQAHNHDDADLQKSLVCSTWSADRSPLEAREGEITLQGVDSPEVNGDRARADVRITAEDGRGETTNTWQLIRSDDTWVVCN